MQTFIGSAVKKNSKMMKSGKYAGISADIESLLKCKFKSIDCRLLGSRINGTTITVKAPLDICAILGKQTISISYVFLSQPLTMYYFLLSRRKAPRKFQERSGSYHEKGYCGKTTGRK